MEPNLHCSGRAFLRDGLSQLHFRTPLHFASREWFAGRLQLPEILRKAEACLVEVGDFQKTLLKGNKHTFSTATPLLKQVEHSFAPRRLRDAAVS